MANLLKLFTYFKLRAKKIDFIVRLEGRCNFGSKI